MMTTRLQRLITEHGARFELPSKESNLPVRTAEFPSFPKLPNELRRKIWGYAAFQPRMVKLLVIEDDRPSQSARVLRQTRVPAMLHVNKEARDEGFRYYWEVKERGRWKPRLDAQSNPIQAARGAVGRPARVRGDTQECNKFYVNFEVDYFVQLPIRQSTTRVLKLHNLNFEPWVIQMIKKLQLTHLWTGCYKDLENICAPLNMTKKLVELTILIDFWSRGPREEDNVLGHARYNLAKAKFDAGLGRLKRFNSKIKTPDDFKIKWVSRSDPDLPAWSSDIDKFQVIDEALPPPVPYGAPFSQY